MKLRGRRQTGRRLALAVAAVPLLAGGFFAASAATAQASAKPAADPAVQNDCNVAGALCFWKDTFFGGEKGVVMGNNGNWADLAHGDTCPGGNWNNCISSAFDEQGHGVRLWQFSGDTGGFFCIANNTGFSDFTQHAFSNGDPLNDAVSANFFRPTGAC